MFHIRFVPIQWSKPWPHLLYVVVVFCHIAKKHVQVCTSRQIGSFRSFPQGQGMKSNNSFPGFLPEANWRKLLRGFRPVRCLRSWRSNCGAGGQGAEINKRLELVEDVQFVKFCSRKFEASSICWIFFKGTNKENIWTRGNAYTN